MARKRSVKATIHPELQPVINSPQAYRRHLQTQAANSQNDFNSRLNMFERASKLVSNIGGSELIRTNFLQFLLDGPRDIDQECGYPAWLTPDHYRAMYDREGVAKRVVECLPDETWALDPEVYEDEDPDVETKFEKEWKKLVKTMDIFNILHRIDVMSGIGSYGILLFGIDDGLDLREPVEGFDDDGGFDDNLDYKLQFIRPFSEIVTFVKTRETDVTNPRYGLPTRYTLQFRDFPNWGIQAGEIIARDVHWTRVLHVADNLLRESNIYGFSRMQQVYNRLVDLRKVYASSGEGYWKGGFPGISFEMHPDINQQGVQLDEESLKKQMADFQNNLQRYFAVVGMTAKTMPSNITEPTSYAESHLKAIAIALGIPYRILFGSEEAKLAGDQDNRAWNRRLGRRQSKYVTPRLVRPFVDRMIAYGVLPKPKDYFVDWPDLGSPTDKDKATIGLQKSQAMQAYIQGGGSQLMAPQDFLTSVQGYTNEEAESILDNAGEFNGGDGNEGGEEDYETDEEDQQRDEGSLGGPAVPDQGNVLTQKNLGRETTTAPGAKQVDTELVHMPELNQLVQNHVVKKGDKYYVVSSDRKKNLSGGYDSKADAVERLEEIEYFKANPKAGDAVKNMLSWFSKSNGHRPKTGRKRTGVVLC